jgi:hypothetical protein
MSYKFIETHNSLHRLVAAPKKGRNHKTMKEKFQKERGLMNVLFISPSPPVRRG